MEVRDTLREGTRSIVVTLLPKLMEVRDRNFSKGSTSHRSDAVAEVDGVREIYTLIEGIISHRSDAVAEVDM
jgi:hypothetical protein